MDCKQVHMHGGNCYRQRSFDPDVIYIRPPASTKPGDSMRYYEMLFVYTDDILFVSHKPKGTLAMFDHHYLLKPDSIGVPEIYLGDQIKQFDIYNDSSQRCWALSACAVVGIEKEQMCVTHAVLFPNWTSCGRFFEHLNEPMQP